MAVSTFNAWCTFYPKSAVLILYFAPCLHLYFFTLSLQFTASVCMNLPLVHSLNFAVCRQHNILTITMKHNCTQCIQYHVHVQCNVITYDLYIINILCFILIRISTLVKLFYCEKIIFLSPPSPRLCVVSLFSWSVKPACTPLTKSEEKVRLPTV